ncbi:MAG: AmmeMemoRadiSam system protein A [Bacillota bacterium]
MPLEPAARDALLRLARESIHRRLAGDGSLPQPDFATPVMDEPRATFVTLKLDGMLRGCIGTLEAQRPLRLDVAHNARAAAFHDPRFAPLSRLEFEPLHIEISVLSPPRGFHAASREALLAELKPGVDGLILQEGGRRATFLPAVWESLLEPEQFLSQLLLKAGLPAAHWSNTLRFARYTTESFSEKE